MLTSENLRFILIWNEIYAQFTPLRYPTPDLFVAVLELFHRSQLFTGCITKPIIKINNSCLHDIMWMLWQREGKMDSTKCAKSCAIIWCRDLYPFHSVYMSVSCHYSWLVASSCDTNPILILRHESGLKIAQFCRRTVRIGCVKCGWRGERRSKKFVDVI